MKRYVSRLCAAFVMMTAAAAAVPVCSDPATLRLAVIPQIKDQAVGGHYDTLLDTLKDELDRNVVLVPVGSYGAVIEGLFDGSVDLAELGPGSYGLARDRGTDISAFASMQRQADTRGPSAYHAVLVTLQSTGLRSLEALKGLPVSLVDPASTSGGIVPRAMLLRMTGMPLEKWFGRVSFAGSHDAAIKAVLNGRVAAAFVSDTWLGRVAHEGRPATAALRVIWQSDPIPSDPFVYQNRLCEPVKQSIRRVFFERTHELRPLLEWRGRTGFVPVSDSDYRMLMEK